MVKILPSLLSIDFLNLKEELQLLETAKVDGLHFDVMDGKFVPNISIGIPILDAVRQQSHLPIDVHLMIEQPENYINLFAEHGADMISVHVESTTHIHRGKKAGVVINPGTSVETILPILSIVDYVLVMTVNPGFGGQTFIEQCVTKIEQLNQLKHENHLTFDIEVDGGINDQTSKRCVEQGATMLVTGSYFFKQEDYAKVTSLLKE